MCIYIYIYIISVASRVLSREARVHAILNVVRPFPCFPPAVSVRKEARCSPCVFRVDVTSLPSTFLILIPLSRSAFFFVYFLEMYIRHVKVSFCFVVKQRKRVNRIKIKSYLI